MIRTTSLLPLLCLCLTSSFIFCSESNSDEEEPVNILNDSSGKSQRKKSDSGSSDEGDDSPSASPTHRPSLPSAGGLFSHTVSTSLSTTTSQATTSSSLAAPIAPRRLSDQESKQPFMQLSPKRQQKSFIRKRSGSSQSSSSGSTAAQTTKSADSPEFPKRKLDPQVAAEATLMTSQGAAPVARAEIGLLARFWSAAQPYVQCQRTITESAIADNTFCEIYSTAPSRFSAMSQTFTEYTLQAEQKLKKDYFMRVKTAFIFAQQNNIPVLIDQSQALLEKLRKKQQEYAELEQLLTIHTMQATTKAHPKKSHKAKGKKSHTPGDQSE